MKKVIIAILSVILVTILGFGGFMLWKLNEKMDEQNGKISNLINDAKGNEEDVENNTNITNGTNVTNNTVNAVNNTTNTVNQNGSNNTTGGTTNNQTTSNTSLEEQIKSAYLTKLKNTYIGYVDYRIDGIKILTEEEKKSLLNLGYQSTDVLAVVGYSIKPQSTEGYVVAGNGEISGDWVINKSACVCYRNGEIVSDGTGW